MARLIGPDEASRKAETIDSSGRFAAKRNRPATVYSDAAATQLADVLWLDGTPVPGSVITIDAYSMLSLFQFPDGVDTLFVVVDGGPAWPIYARTDDRLDALGGRVGTVEGVAAAAETPAGAQAKADAAQTASAQRAANLSDLANAATARTNLGLGNAATRNVGTTAGTVAQGDDSRIVNAMRRHGYVFTDPSIGGVGDGVTDNTSAWNAAMALLEATGGTLYFPNGVYCIAGTTADVPGGSMLVGTGLNYGAPRGSAPEGLDPSRGAVIRATAPMTRLVQLGRNAGTSAQTDTGASMRDLIVDGQDLAVTVVKTSGRRDYIYDCQIYWGASYGVRFDGHDSYIFGGVVAQNNKGDCLLVAFGGDHKVFDVQLRQPGTTGACIRLHDVSDVMVRGNHIWSGQNGVATTAQALIVVHSETTDIVDINICDNIIEGVLGAEIEIRAATSRTIRSVGIHGNTIYMPNAQTDNAYPVISAVAEGTSTASLVDVSITGNIIRAVTLSSRWFALIKYVGTFASTLRWVITGNSMFGVTALTSGSVPNVPLWGHNTMQNGTASVATAASGIATFSGDGTTTAFTIATSLAAAVRGFGVREASSAAGTATIAYAVATGTGNVNILVNFKAAPASGANNVALAWTASV